MAEGKPMDGFPLDTEFLDALEGELQEQAKELLDGVSIGSLWVSTTLRGEAETSTHGPAFMLLALTHCLMDTTMRIAQIESAKNGVLGIDPDMVLNAGRSVISALAISCIRFGQRHPDAFGGDLPEEAVGDLMTAIQEALRGGEAGDEETKQ